MASFKWGVIGPGNIAEDFVSDLSLIGDPYCSIAAVYAPREASAAAFAEEHQVDQFFTNLDEFVRIEMGAVYIASPHTFHFEQSLKCLEHNIPVLCEKPVTINTEQLTELIALSKKNNTFLMEGMWTRFLPSIHKVLELLQDKSIGDIVCIKGSMSYKAPEDPGNRYFNPELGGGSLLDLGIYPVFLATLIAGKPIAINASAVLSDKGIDEYCSVLLQYSNGRFASLESSIVTQSDLVAEIHGTKGKIKILSPWNEKPAGIELDIYNEKKITFPCKWQGHGFQFEVMEVIRLIRKGEIESPQMPHAFSLTMMEIMDEVRNQVNVKYDRFE